jgi:hypothetical protein
MGEHLNAPVPYLPRHIRARGLPIHGQTANTGAIAGTVSDPSGALVPRAAVVINSQGTAEKRDLATDAEGNFLIQFLTPGNYSAGSEFCWTFLWEHLKEKMF